MLGDVKADGNGPLYVGEETVGQMGMGHYMMGDVRADGNGPLCWGDSRADGNRPLDVGGTWGRLECCLKKLWN